MSLEGGDYKNLVDQLITEAKESNCHTVILSDESICKKSPLKHNYLKSFFDEIKVIFFLRRQDLFLESYYNQIIKRAWKKKRCFAEPETLIDYGLSLDWLHFDKLLDGFSAIFGRDAIMAFPFERGAIPKNIGRFFLLDVCGAKKNNLKLDQTVANTSIPYSSLGILRSLNKRDRSVISEGGAPRQIIEGIIKREFSDASKYIIDHKARKAFMKNYQTGNNYVAENHVTPASKQLFKIGLPPANTPIQKTTTSNNMTIDVMEKIIVALANQLRDK